jgi:NitT/TauT family transport system ATP-binding protein
MVSHLALERVTKRYGDGIEGVVAIDDVSFHVEQGEFCTILGPSGCGKSTIISLIAGFIPVTSGKVLVNGAIVTKPGPDRVVVSQDYSLFAWKTVRANVEFGLKARRIPRAERQMLVQHYLALVHLTTFADRYPAELSGGMRQRGALARALAVEPACLLLDEPLAALDMQMRQALQDELLAIWRQTRHTVVMVTHDLDEALYLSDRVLVMGPRPGHVHTIIPVPFSRPRRPELRLTDAFQALKREVSRDLSKPCRDSLAL